MLIGRTIIKEQFKMNIKIENYNKSIRKSKVLRDVNLSLASGTIYGLKGINGSGKTMLMRAISGLILPTSGRVLIDDKEIGRDIAFPPSIGMLLENPAFIGYRTGKDNLKLIASIQNKISDEEIVKALKMVGLDPEDKRTYRKYSLGMKQRLGIAAAIMGSPELVILDEPMNALDESAMELVRSAINELKNNGSLVIIACHDRSILESLADIIYTINEGQIIDE